MVRWAPRESGDSRLVHDKLVEFYFFLDHEPLRELQSSISPDAAQLELTPLSQWIHEYAVAWGSYLDTPESAVQVDTSRTNPAFRWHAMVDPRHGYFVNNDLAGYHVLSHADIPAIEAVFLDEVDDKANPLKIPGVGDLGISGAGAALANAVDNACGVRVRDYPISLDKVLAGLG